ncbi:ABC transporter ATP-binding protein [Tateyamaria omphalii]|uniref:ABC transporter ATP-binding protein n=1 Tax=Tateyamaria omphalii TaxID=299262 RepID=UPI0019ACE00D|nr:ATP-binding cassette domain-containing protein [Tateyamaria omphalii]GGX71612.1 ABC transporter ATP-binding protein [Tateyamaria omphalii]
MASLLLDLVVRSLCHDDTPILQDVSLKLARGETLALVGPSGIGKSSLLRVIASLHTAFDGTCVLTGTCAMVFQEPTLLPWRTVWDNIGVTTGADAEQIDAALSEVGLAGRRDDYPGQLSLGQQRRLALARAFAVKPDLLLLDEPFVSLDAELVDEMMTLFARLRATHNVTTILVTHVAQEAEKLASRIVTLGGSPATIVSDVQNDGAYFQLSASGVTSSRS